MALTLPGLTGGGATIIAPAMYPLTRADIFDTAVYQFINGQEQRWMNRAALGGATLKYRQVHSADRAALDSFVEQVLGSAEPWTFSTGPYGSLTFSPSEVPEGNPTNPNHVYVFMNWVAGNSAAFTLRMDSPAGQTLMSDSGVDSGQLELSIPYASPGRKVYMVDTASGTVMASATLGDSTLGIPGQSYGTAGADLPNCEFLNDSFAWTENAQYPNFYDGQIQFRQINKGGLPQGGNLTALFPSFGPNQACATGAPYTLKRRFQTARVDLPNGYAQTYPFFGAGLSGFPSRELRGFELTLSTLSDADVAMLEEHFLAAGGRFANFSFYNPGDITYRVRYDMDQLEISNIAPGISSTVVQLKESYGPGWIP